MRRKEDWKVNTSNFKVGVSFHSKTLFTTLAKPVCCSFAVAEERPANLAWLLCSHSLWSGVCVLLLSGDSPCSSTWISSARVFYKVNVQIFKH